MKKHLLLPLLLFFLVMIAGCNHNDDHDAEPSPESEYAGYNQSGSDNAESSPENGHEMNLREDNTAMEKSIDFNLENTIQVLNEALVDAEVTAESGIVEILQEAGVRGAVQAELIDEPGRVLVLEIVSEDEKTYELVVARRVFSDITYYAVHAIQDMQSGEYIFSEEGGFGDANP